MASPFATYGAAFFATEYRVNGLWNQIISQHWTPGFAAGNHLVSSEAYPRVELTSGFRADLLVNGLIVHGTTMGTSPHLLVYEGKGDNNKTTDWEKIQEQLCDWLGIAVQTVALKERKCWVLGAWGSKVRCYFWTNKDNLVPKAWNGHPQTVGVASQVTYDITDHGEWAIVQGMLTYMRAHPQG